MTLNTEHMESQSNVSTSKSGASHNEVSMSLALAREEFAEFLTTDEKINLNGVDIDNFVAAKRNLDSLGTDDGIVKALVKHWVQFLQLNEAYKSYCFARRRKDQTIISALEESYPAEKNVSIKKLYLDWGDVHAEEWEFEKWFVPRQNLFAQPRKKIEYVGEKTVPDIGEVWVSIPKGIKNKQELSTLFSQFYNKHYLNDYASYRPAYPINGRASTSLVQKLDMATMVADLLSYRDDAQDRKRDREYSHAQVVKTIMFNPLLRYICGVGEEWKRDADRLSNHAKNGDIPLTSPEIVKKKPYIIDLERFFEECIEKSILGIFPAR